jgi:hypothetical protein
MLTTKISSANERGAGRLKFLFVIAIIGGLAYAGYLFVPVLYNAYLFRDLMQHNVDVAVTQGYPVSWVKDQLTKGGPEYGVPPDAEITPSQHDNRIEVRVQFTRPIKFPGYTYEYKFDYSAKSTAFLTFK